MSATAIRIWVEAPVATPLSPGPLRTVQPAGSSPTGPTTATIAPMRSGTDPYGQSEARSAHRRALLLRALRG